MKNFMDTIAKDFEDFQSEVQAAVGQTGIDVSPDAGRWALDAGIKLDRGLFSFDRHEYLQEPYSDNHPYQVEMKCTQMGNTVRAILRTCHCCLRYRDIVGIIYLFPSRRGSGDFSRSRITPLVMANPDSLGRHIKDTDSVELKRIAGKNVYFRGARAKEGLLSDPADMIVYDEYDLMDDGIEGIAEGRLAHSDYKWQHFLSNPSMPDYGIDKKFAMSDKKYWLLKCPGCGKYTCMEDHFPECLHETADGRVIRLCMNCRDKELDPAQGVWVARKPSVLDVRGYHYSQLWSQYVTPESLLKTFRTTKKLQWFYNFWLGLPYTDARHRLSMEEIYALCATHGIASSDKGPCWMGVDQKADALHVVIGRSHPDRLVYIGHHLEWEELDKLMDNFKVSLCVADALPETRNARAFAERRRGRVFLNFYSEHQKGDYVWNEARMTVSSNRNESLDASHSAIQDADLTLPRRCEPVEEFTLHCHNIAKKIEEDEDGNKTYRYVRLGEDHYRHSFNYAWIARSKAVGSLFGGSDLS